jgi:hypothetical protein
MRRRTWLQQIDEAAPEPGSGLVLIDDDQDWTASFASITFGVS